MTRQEIEDKLARHDTEIERLWLLARSGRPDEANGWMPRWLRITLRVVTGFGVAFTPLLVVILSRGHV